ncbi:MAG: hypothetical protein IJ759_07475 [Bacteroidales bacterium]|nr:hypothetical protein [Bacteroidales bacterium]
MKRISTIILFLSAFVALYAQRADYSIEYETHKIGVFNPEWETSQTLNPKKFEHITGYFREELAQIIINGVKEKKVKIYDNRKRELNLDSVISQIISFEKQLGTYLDKKDVWNYIIPYISAYDFEEAVNYNYKNLTIEKQIISYQPYIVHYKSFNEDGNDTVQMPLFWIFPKDTAKDNPKHPIDRSVIYIPDTVLSVLQLKYPVKMPFTASLFDKIQNKKIPLLHSDGTEFASPKEIDDLFVLKSTATIYNDETGEEKAIDTYSDLTEEDITAVRIAENWAIKPYNLEILKTVQYFLPLYPYDENLYRQLGVRITCNKNSK